MDNARLFDTLEHTLLGNADEIERHNTAYNRRAYTEAHKELCSVPRNNVVVYKVKQNAEGELRQLFADKARKKICHCYKPRSFKRIGRDCCHKAGVRNGCKCACCFTDNAENGVENELWQICSRSSGKEHRHKPIPEAENCKRNFAQKNVRLELAPTGTGTVNNNADKGIVYCIPQAGKQAENRKEIEIEINYIVNKSVVVFADVEAGCSIVEQVTDLFTCADKPAVNQFRIFYTLLIVQVYTRLLLLGCRTCFVAFGHHSASVSVNMTAVNAAVKSLQQQSFLNIIIFSSTFQRCFYKIYTIPRTNKL